MCRHDSLPLVVQSGHLADFHRDASLHAKGGARFARRNGTT
jgi:hypothetical protein